MVKIINWWKKWKRQLITGAILGAAVLFLLGAFCFLVSAEDIGTERGNMRGNIVGTAIGSVNGVTTGLAKGSADGAEAGLSAVDTNVDIAAAVKTVGKLEVLSADVSLTDFQTIGEVDTRLICVKGNAVFTVDVSKAGIRFEESTIHIVLPKPEVTLYLYQDSSEVLAESEHFSFDVGAKDGIEAYINSMKNIVQNSTEKIANYDALMDAAKDAAKRQVERLATAACAGDYTLDVKFP